MVTWRSLWGPPHLARGRTLYSRCRLERAAIYGGRCWRVKCDLKQISEMGLRKLEAKILKTCFRYLFACNYPQTRNILKPFYFGFFLFHTYVRLVS